MPLSRHMTNTSKTSGSPGYSPSGRKIWIKLPKRLRRNLGELKTIEASLAEKKTEYNAETHRDAKTSCDRLSAEIASINARIESEAERLRRH